MDTLEFVRRVLDLFWENKDSLHWRVDGEYAPVSFFVMCNDFFDWACADVEAITPDNLPVLEQALKDCKALDNEEWGAELFCARVREMRPQGAFYKSIPEELWPLFDACGPVRQTGFGNPVAHE